VRIGEDGIEYSIYSFDELLPHHVRYVQKCFRSFDHFYETRAGNGLLEYVQGFDKRAALPHADTCKQILETIDELVEEKIKIIISKHMHQFGTPCAGSTSDIWSMKSCRESFACLRGSFVLDGDMLAELVGGDKYKGKLVDMSPILAFARFTEKHHTGDVLARWKKGWLKQFNLGNAIGLATEDGASNNKKANKILGQEMKVCDDHEIARAVLFASGDAGSVSRNPELKAFSAKAGKQSAAFSRSVSKRPRWKPTLTSKRIRRSTRRPRT